MRNVSLLGMGLGTALVFQADSRSVSAASVTADARAAKDSVKILSRNFIADAAEKAMPAVVNITILGCMRWVVFIRVLIEEQCGTMRPAALVSSSPKMVSS